MTAVDPSAVSIGLDAGVVAAHQVAIRGPGIREDFKVAPTLAGLSEQYRSRGVSFLGVDVSDTPVNALAFTRSVGITYPSVNDSGYSVTQDFSQVVPISGTPTTIVVDRTGHVAGYIYGGVTYSALNALLGDVAVTR